MFSFRSRDVLIVVLLSAKHAAKQKATELRGYVRLWLWLAQVMVLASVACGPGDIVDAREHKPRVEAACIAAFDSVLIAWERMRGPVPAECVDLPSVYTVTLSDEMPGCERDPGQPGKLVGCTFVNERQIYLRAGRTQVGTVDIAIHEWLHALDGCAARHVDIFHDDEELWSDFGVNTIEQAAIFESSLGECL